MLHFFGLHNHSARRWTSYPSTFENCDPGPQKCCVPLGNVDSQGVFHYVDVPEDGRVTGNFQYLDNNDILSQFNPEKVTVEHYYPSVGYQTESTKFYFNANQERTGHFSDTIHWQPGEIATYGQKLAVCAVQNTNPGTQNSFYSMEVYLEVPA